MPRGLFLRDRLDGRDEMAAFLQDEERPLLCIATDQIEDHIDLLSESLLELRLSIPGAGHRCSRRVGPGDYSAIGKAAPAPESPPRARPVLFGEDNRMPAPKCRCAPARELLLEELGLAVNTFVQTSVIEPLIEPNRKRRRETST